MKNFVLGAALCVVMLSSCSMKQEVCCADHPIKPFKAVYELSMNGRPAGTQTWLSDGTGKVVMKLGTDQPQNFSTLVDYVNHKLTIIDGLSKTAESRQIETPWVSNASMEQLNATVLGDKTIDGHPCKGWKVTNADTISEYWLGDDTGCYVEVDTSNSSNSQVSKLKLAEYSPELPAGTSFTVPADYKMK